MSGNYSNVDGVELTTWGPESDPENPEREINGKIEEMYFDYGNLYVNVTHEDGETVTTLEIPIKARVSWNGFVESLPTWDLE